MAMNEDQNGNQNIGPAETARDPQLDAAYRASVGASGGDGPPAALDDAIRAAARRAVGARPGMPGRSFSRWRLPLSVAAVLVLSVSLVTLMREEGHDRLPAEDPVSSQVPPTTRSGAPAAPATATAPAQDRVEPVAAPKKAAPPAASTPPPQRQVVAPPALHAAGDPLPKAEKRAVLERAPVADSANALTAGTPALAEQAASPAPVPQAFAPSLSDRGVDAGSALQRRSAEAGARDERAPAVAAAGRAQERRLLRSAPPPAPVAAASPATPWADLIEAPAKDWLARMRELRRAGRGDDADAMLVEFRRRFPDIELPDDLR